MNLRGGGGRGGMSQGMGGYGMGMGGMPNLMGMAMPNMGAGMNMPGESREVITWVEANSFLGFQGNAYYPQQGGDNNNWNPHGGKRQRQE